MSVLDMNTYKLGFELKEQHSRGESNSPGFYIFCKRQFMKFYLFCFYSLLFSFSINFLASHTSLVRPIIRGVRMKSIKR